MGSLHDEQWLYSFFVGNLFWFSSIWLLMLVYRELHPNIALGLATVGAFLLSQIAIVYFFKSYMSLTQWGGIVLIVVGVMMLTNMKIDVIE